MIRRLSLCLVLAVLALPATAHAAPTAVDSVGLPLVPPLSQTIPPPGFSSSARQAIAAADRTKATQKLRDSHPGVRSQAMIWYGSIWQVQYFTGKPVLLEIDVSPSGHVTHVWRGLQAGNYFTRGHFGGLFDSSWVLLPFALAFLAPFVDRKRPFRLLHLDLLVLLSFGVSYWLFRNGHANSSVWLVYPPLLYLLVRMLVAGLRPSRPRGRLVPVAPTALLAVGLVVLVGARVGLDVASHRVLDVGYASVVGADRIAHRQPLYVDNDSHGDTYGPVAYVAYIPFELLFPWHGRWDSLPSARAAAITFDLLTILGLFLLGRQMRAGPEGRRLGLALAWAWAAFPFTLCGVILNTNDGLVAMLIVYALLVYQRSPAARGLMLGLATAAKFFPGALVPLFAAGRDTRLSRRTVECWVAALAVVVLALLLFLPDGGVRELWNCTLGYQLRRHPDFSLWAIHPGIGWTQRAAEVAALALVGLLAFRPRQRSFVQLCALGAAATIALQIPAGHWFYFYIAWFTPLVLVALFAAHREPLSEPDFVPARLTLADNRDLAKV